MIKNESQHRKVIYIHKKYQELSLLNYEKDIILTNPEVLRNAKPYNPSSGSTRRKILDIIEPKIDTGEGGSMHALPSYDKINKDSTVVAGHKIPSPPK
ncbi:13016_t:CDS:2, partial [Funneliformis mosseae]